MRAHALPSARSLRKRRTPRASPHPSALSPAPSPRLQEGIVIAVEKRLLSVLQEPGSVEKIFEVDSHIGVAMSGLSADARTLVDHARSETQYHRRTCTEPIPVRMLAS